MKIDKTTYKGRKERLNVMTADNTSRPEKVLFFSTAHFLKIILASRTNGTFAFAPIHKDYPSAKAKEPFFNSHEKSTFTNINLKLNNYGNN
jgi:hypothetical protein